MRTSSASAPQTGRGAAKPRKQGRVFVCLGPRGTPFVLNQVRVWCIGVDGVSGLLCAGARPWQRRWWPGFASRGRTRALSDGEPGWCAQRTVRSPLPMQVAHNVLRHVWGAAVAAGSSATTSGAWAVPQLLCVRPQLGRKELHSRKRAEGAEKLARCLRS